MRQAEHIWDVWDNGSYVGNERSHGRVTIEADWFLNITPKSYGPSNRGPFRWYQRPDNAQDEVELPNVKSINIDRSLDTDIASCNIQIYNQWMNTNGELPDLTAQLGTPGYLGWGHGNNSEAVARWNQSVNSWENVILPNALIRTYQGYGGFNEDGTPMAIRDAEAIGALVLTGVWLVDAVTLGSNAMIDVKTRDVGKFLGVQQYFPPLIPTDAYQVQFCRWQYKDFDAKFNPRLPTTTGSVETRAPRYVDSSSDRWYGTNFPIHGHYPTDSVDGDGSTYAMSVGNYHPSKLFCTDWWEYEVNGQLNEVFVHPWAGNYTMYVSVMENGVWQSNNEGLIPYDPGELIGTNLDDFGNPHWVDTEANIPFVMKTGVPWEEGRWYALGRTYNAQRIRISFRDHTLTDLGPWLYRSGIRETLIRMNTQVTSPPGDPWTFSIANYNNPSVVNESGYWVVADDGQVFAFGDARMHDRSSLTQIESTNTFPVVTLIPAPDGQGYYLMQTNGVVVSYGSATWQGNGHTNPYNLVPSDFIDMALTPTGLGYWMLRRSGEVVAVGDAVHQGNAVPTGFTENEAAYTGTGIESHPSIAGYWIVDGDGQVQAFGGVPDIGGITPYRHDLKAHEWVRGIRRDSAGTGLWLLGGSGHVYNVGTAADWGQAIYPSDIGSNAAVYEQYRKITWSIAPTSNDDGYLILMADGHIFGAGTFQYFGEPGLVGQIREDGNYKDYADIVKLLLAWSGFLYHDDSVVDPNATPNIPEVYGNIESTGAYAEECIGLDVFDKHPIIDCINRMKEIVGYIFYIDDEGAARFESPNWWSIGNFWSDGTPTDFLPEIDERTVLSSYGITYSDDTARSEIIITTEVPEMGNTTTATTRLVPANASILRGIVKPAMWVNGLFKNMDEQKIMAELIAMHMWFQQRTGSVTAIANPCIGVNDQVRIIERVTSETYVHYIRGMSTSHDLDTGVYMMNLNTHWLGDEDGWAITKDNIPTGTGASPTVTLPQIQISDDLLEFLRMNNSRAVMVARLNDFGQEPDPDRMNYDIPPPASGTGGSADGVLA